MIAQAQESQWTAISTVFSAISPSRKTSIRSVSTNKARIAIWLQKKAAQRICDRRKINNDIPGRNLNETPRLHEVKRRSWGSGDADATIASARASKIGFQSVRRAAPRLPHRGRDRESGQEARGCHQRAALGPDVSIDAARRRERDHRTDSDRCDPDVARQRRDDGTDCR